MAKLTAKEKAILNNMKLLEISREEAEELYAFDNDEIENEEVDAIEDKVSERKEAMEGRSSIEKVKHMKAKQKGDAHKEAIIAEIFAATEAAENVHFAMEVSSTKMSFQDAEGNFYTVQVTKHKTQPAGYVWDPAAASQAEETEEDEVDIVRISSAAEGSSAKEEI